MYSVAVIPLIPGISKDTLTYFSKNNFKVGDVLGCPFRNKTILGIVLECSPLQNSKSALKSSDFIIRNIKNSESHKKFFTESFINQVTLNSRLYLLSYSAVFYSLVPQVFFDTFDLLKTSTVLEPTKVSKNSEILKYQLSQLKAPEKILELIKNFKNVVIMAPTVERAEFLEKNIKNNSVLLHGSLTKNRQKSQRELLLKTDKILICTPAFASLVQDPDIFIIDSFESDSYSNPRLSGFNFANFYTDVCLNSRTKCVHLDSLLSSDEDLEETLLKENFKIIDMTDSTLGTKNFWLSKTLMLSIFKTVSEGGNVLLYVSRKGLATSLVCRDCKNIVSCIACGGQKSLTETKHDRVLTCAYCSTREHLDFDQNIICSKCSSWNIDTKGVGTNLIANTINKNGLLALLYDSDNIKSNSQTKKLVKEFEETPGSILVATDISTSYFNKKIDLVAVVSLDSRLSIPVFSTDFKVLKLLRNLATLSKNEILIQTRLKEYPLLSRLREGVSVETLKENDLGYRKELGYPPFGIFIEIVKNNDFTPKEREYLDTLKASKVLYRNYKNLYISLIKLEKTITKVPDILNNISSNISFVAVRVHR